MLVGMATLPFSFPPSGTCGRHFDGKCTYGVKFAMMQFTREKDCKFKHLDVGVLGFLEMVLVYFHVLFSLVIPFLEEDACIKS